MKTGERAYHCERGNVRRANHLGVGAYERGRGRVGSRGINIIQLRKQIRAVQNGQTFPE